VEIAPIKQNTDESEFGPYVVGNTIYYTSSQERKVGVISMEAATLHQMLDLYSGKLIDSINVGKIKPLPGSINTPLNQGGCFFDKTTSKLYYSTNIPCENYPKKLKLAIYSSILQNDVFLEPKAELVLPDTFMAAHPYIYNNKLYFASNMSGGKGKTDIYYAEKLTESWDNLQKWGNFKNCDFINTEENEYFPFVINENEFYFSSDRKGGLGKLDLYKYTSDGRSRILQNAGAPINSEFDDFAIYIDSLQEKGYFSTNREDNQDDIYFFRQTWPTFTNCKESIPEDYCYNLSEESSLDKAGAGGFYYEWLFGDGTKQKGLAVRHCFPGPGNYLINLNIIDSLTKSVFMSQATFDLKVDSIVQLKINCLDTVPVHKTFGMNTLWTYLPDNKIEGYYFEIDNKKIRGTEIKHSFSKPGIYKVLLGVVTFNTKTGKKELLCTTKNIVCINQEAWAKVEERKFDEVLTKYAYRAFKLYPDTLNLITGKDIEMLTKMGLNGKKLGKEIKSKFAAKINKKEITEEVLAPGQTKFAYTQLRMDTLMRLKEQDDITFKVHFGTSKTRKDTSHLSTKGLYGIEEKMIDELYHYTYGNEKKINEIEKYYQRSLKAGVGNPVVIGYKNDKIIFDQSANIHPATFEETMLNNIKDSIYAGSPINYTEPKTEEPVLSNTPDNINQENIPASKTEPDKTENNTITSSAEKTTASDPLTEKKSGSSKTENTKTGINNTNNNESVTNTATSAKKSKQNSNKEPLIDPNEDLNISNEKEFNTLTNVQKKMEYYLQKYGDISVKDLEFRVQVGAFRKRKSYRFPKLAGLGTISNEEHTDGITRMTIGGSFQKLSEAFNFTKKVVNAGQEDAFVSVYYKGKRVYIENLERRGVFYGQDNGNLTEETPTGSGEAYSGDPETFITESGEFVARTNIQKKIVMYTQKYGNISADGLEFKVQIAVFKHRKNYNFPRLKNLGSINVEALNEGSVRITIGESFKTLGEAFELNKKVVIAGQTDAFVSVFYRGKRIYIENLERKGIFVVNKN
jgi:hypothetical protein